jgi:hypothetical protein
MVALGGFQIGPAEIQRIPILQADVRTGFETKDEAGNLHIVPAMHSTDVFIPVAGLVNEPASDAIGLDQSEIVRFQQPYCLADIGQHDADYSVPIRVDALEDVV